MIRENKNVNDINIVYDIYIIIIVKLYASTLFFILFKLLFYILYYAIFLSILYYFFR